MDTNLDAAHRRRQKIIDTWFVPHAITYTRADGSDSSARHHRYRLLGRKVRRVVVLFCTNILTLIVASSLVVIGIALVVLFYAVPAVVSVWRFFAGTPTNVF